MSDFWAIIPRAVRKSKVLTGDEKALWYEIAENLDNAGCCKMTNKDFANIFDTTTKTITNRISELKRKGYLCVTQETHNHTRRLYPKYPGEIDELKPTEEKISLKVEKLQEACQKGIKLDDLQFVALVDKLRYSPILDEIKDNSTQFVLSLEQLTFLARFIELFPNKAIDMQLASVVKLINYDELLHEVQQSKLLRTSNNLSLKWLIDNYEDIVEKKKYAPFVNREEVVRGRTYTREELNALIPSVDEVEI